jgi:hypothetical protein
MCSVVQRITLWAQGAVRVSASCPEWSLGCLVPCDRSPKGRSAAHGAHAAAPLFGPVGRAAPDRGAGRDAARALQAHLLGPCSPRVGHGSWARCSPRAPGSPAGPVQRGASDMGSWARCSPRLQARLRGQWSAPRRTRGAGRAVQPARATSNTGSWARGAARARAPRRTRGAGPVLPRAHLQAGLLGSCSARHVRHGELSLVQPARAASDMGAGAGAALARVEACLLGPCSARHVRHDECFRRWGV